MTASLPPLTLPHVIFTNPASAVLFPVTLGTAIGLSTRAEARKTYTTLKQPQFSPPPWVFGPAWTLLYGLMGYASYRAFTAGTTSFAPPSAIKAAHDGAALYTAQLGLNVIWNPLFFVAKRPIEATVDLVVLLGLNGYLTYTWSRVDKMAAWCMVPYLAWLGFATYLAAGVGHLNRWELGNKKPAGIKQKDKKR